MQNYDFLLPQAAHVWQRSVLPCIPSPLSCPTDLFFSRNHDSDHAQIALCSTIERGGLVKEVTHFGAQPSLWSSGIAYISSLRMERLLLPPLAFLRYVEDGGGDCSRRRRSRIAANVGGKGDRFRRYRCRFQGQVKGERRSLGMALRIHQII